MPQAGAPGGRVDASKSVLPRQVIRPVDGSRSVSVELPLRHYRRPVESPFTRAERAHVTLLYGGLTVAHDCLIGAAMEGLGYKVALLPVPTKADFQAGREFGNNGQCNPTYFTVGALVNYLQRLRDEQGLPVERIVADYVLVTAGSCGPCRFGMYEAEYRLALAHAGFDGFRVLVLNQEQGIAGPGMLAGLDVDARLVVALLNAVFIGDVLNAVLSHVRPYEIVAGRTDAVFERCLRLCEQALREQVAQPARCGVLARVLARLAGVAPGSAAEMLRQLRQTRSLAVLRQCRSIIDEEIEVDYTRARPIVKITGEFWAQTTEGDGNFRMFRFLEAEGAEVLAEPVATWIDYSLSYWRQWSQDRRGLRGGSGAPPGRWQLGKRLRIAAANWAHDLALAAAGRALAREYNRLCRALGGTVHPLAGQLELQRLGHPFYNSRCGGGEGYLEVAKNIYYGHRDFAHMVLSLKPFGCMPSTQSDGAQVAVLAHYPSLIFLPVETSGEGDINAYSRVQMTLGQAKSRCKEEFNAALARSGYALEDIRAFVAERRELRRPLQAQGSGAIGRAARFVQQVARRMDRDPDWAARRRPLAEAVK